MRISHIAGVLALTLLAGCAGRLLPIEAPEDGAVVRLSRIQGNVGLPPASGFADTCQVVVLGQLKGCATIERDGCRVNTCEVTR